MRVAGCGDMPATPRTNTPMRSRNARRSARSAPTAWWRRDSTRGSPSSGRGDTTPTTTPTRSCMSASKDGVATNTHPLNVLPPGVAPAPVDRIPLYEVYIRMAEELAKRPTSSRLPVGTQPTDQQLENLLAIGYNRNARGPPNRCDSTGPGTSGCSHSDLNAL